MMRGVSIGVLTAILIAAPPGFGDLAARAAGRSFARTAREARRFLRGQHFRQQRAIAAAKRAAAADPARARRLLPDGLTALDAPRPVTYARRGGPRGETFLDPDRIAALAIGESARAARDRQNLLAVYADLYQAIPSDHLQGLPSPAAITKRPLGSVRKQFRYLLGRLHDDFWMIHAAISLTHPLTVADQFIDSCELELGHEAIGGAGQTAERAAPTEYALSGLMRNTAFALKPHLTCIKDQGRRGTCAAQAIAAAVETHLLLAGGQAEDLSEQHLFCDGKLTTDWDHRYEHGLVPDLALDAFAEDGYRFQPESAWNYNRSPDSTGVLDPVTHHYPGSCDDYAGELCTELNFQAEETIAYSHEPTPILQSIHYEFPAANPTDGHRVTGGVQLPDELGLVPGGLLDSVVIILETRPVILGFQMPPSFGNPDGDGYVHHVPGQTAQGAHAVLLVGFVPNHMLPAGTTPDPAGYGYFIAKNSWSGAWGDEGFGYLSGRFLEQWADGYTYVDAVRD